MFDVWRALILSQQESDRWWLTGGFQVQNQPRRGFSRWYNDGKNWYGGMNSPRITLIHHQPWCSSPSKCCMQDEPPLSLFFFAPPVSLGFLHFQNDTKLVPVIDGCLLHSLVSYMALRLRNGVKVQSKKGEVSPVMKLRPFPTMPPKKL